MMNGFNMQMASGKTELKKVGLVLLLLLLTVAGASADNFFPSSKLRNLGINASTLQPITFNHEDTMLAAFDRAPFEEKKKGVFYRLWLFEIGRDGELGKVQSIPLDIKNIQQGEFTPDDQSFVVVGDRGTRFLAVDCSSKNVTEFMSPEWGKAGFRADPAVLWTDGGRLFVTGYPYDRARFVETRTVATVKADRSSERAFERGPDIDTLEKSLERLWFSNYINDRSALFAQKYPSVSILSHWDGENVTEFDRAWKYIGFWANSSRLLLAQKESSLSECELSLYDSNSTELKTLASSPKEYRYLFLSRDGETLLTSQISEQEGRLESYYAKEEQGWELKPVVLDSQGKQRTLASGWMRLSSAGNMMAHLSANGLRLYPLP